MSLFKSLGDILGFGASLVKAGASVYSAVEARKASKRQAQYERDRASRDAEISRRETRRRVGQQRASFAAQGLMLDEEDSTGLLIGETEKFGAQDIRDILDFGNRRANNARKSGRAALIGGGLSGAGELLDGAFKHMRF